MNEDTTTKTKKPRSQSGRGLGRGLDALLGERPSTSEKSPRASSKPTMASMPVPDSEAPIEFLRPNPDQPRKVFSDDAINDLATSIKTRGLLQPILVRPIKDADPQGPLYEIVAGERRWRAAQKAGVHVVPIIIRKLNDEQTAEIALIENIQRVDLGPLEEAEAYHFLATRHKRSQEQIAKAVGKSRSHVANMMRLTTLPEKAKTALSDNTISMGHARALLGSEKVAYHLDATIRQGLSVRQLEALIRQDGVGRAGEKSTETKTVQPPAKKDADTRALERNLAEVLGLEVEIDHRKNGHGIVAIKYLDLDQLDDVCRRLLGSAV